MKSFTTVLLLMLLVSTLKAQEMPTIIPPSPDAAALVKFGDIPVSLYTGVPDISIPLYTIKVRDITIPISLKYHGGGVRIEEEASWVGLGWNLSAGGTITRTIKDKDDLDDKYHYFRDEYLILHQIPEYVGGKCNVGSDESLINLFTNYDFNKGLYDFNPDVFYYSFLSYSGQFIFKQDGSVALLGNQKNLRIQFLDPDNKSKGFIITTPNGMKYTFKEGGKVCHDPLGTDNCSPIDYTVSSWNLASIDSPLGEKVNFKYGYFQSTDISSITYQKMENSLLSNVYACGDNQIIYEAWKDFRNRESDKMTVTYTSYKDSLLSEIDFKHGKILFYKNSLSRADLPGAISLSKIEIRDEVNRTIKQINFGYDYFRTSPTSTDHNELRLKLTTIDETGKPPYSFTYNGIPLPHKKSFKSDYWGYYNGSGSSYNEQWAKLPPFNGDGPTVWTPLNIGAGGVGEPDPEYMKAGILEKINYPTGGYTIFEFEPHTYHVENEKLEYINRPVIVEAIANAYTSTSDPSRRVEIPYEILGNEPILVTVEYEFELESLDGPEYTDDLDKFEVGYLINKRYMESGNNSGQSKRLLKPGNYVIYANVPKGINGFARIKITYDEKKYAGGLRIKKIIMNDGQKNTQETIYEYGEQIVNKENKTVEGRSFGKLMGKPNYVLDFGRYYYSHGGQSSAEVKYRMTQSYSIAPLGVVQGSSVGYDSVIVRYDSLNGRGYSKYAFTNNPEAQFGLYTVSGLPNLKNPSNGSLLFQKDYNQTGRIGREIINGYTTKISDIHFGNYMQYDPMAKAVFLAGFGTLCSAPNPCPDYMVFIWPFMYRSEWNVLSSITERIYNLKGNSYTEKISKFDYNNKFHKQITQKSIKSSDGSTIITYNLYPGDYADSSGWINDLKSSFQHNIIVESVIYKEDEYANTTVTSGIINSYQPGGKGLKETSKYYENDNTNITQFKFSNQKSPGVLPFDTPGQSYSADDDYVDRLKYSYNDGNNITEILKDDGISSVFLWGYGSTYPVVKIDNISITDIPINIVSNIEKHEFKNSSIISDIQIDINYLKSQLQLIINYPKYMVYLYTFDPLIGLTSQTDPNGITTYYKYDEFGRLEFVKDKDGSIVKHYEYNYSGQGDQNK